MRLLKIRPLTLFGRALVVVYRRAAVRAVAAVFQALLLACCLALAGALAAGGGLQVVAAAFPLACWRCRRWPWWWWCGARVAGGAGLPLACRWPAARWHCRRPDCGLFTVAQFNNALLFTALHHECDAPNHAVEFNRVDAVNFILARLPVWISVSAILLA